MNAARQSAQSDRRKGSGGSEDRPAPGASQATTVKGLGAMRERRLAREACTYPMSCRFLVVLMDQAAETIATTHGAVGVGLSRRRLGYGQLETTVRSARVVMHHEPPRGALQVASAEDQEVVEALPASRSHPSLGEGVRLGGPDRRLDDPDALGPDTSSKEPENFESRSRITNRTP